MARAIVLTVGKGSAEGIDMSVPLAKAVRESQAERVVMLHTADPGSRKAAADIRETLGLDDDTAEDVELHDPFDPGPVFQQAADALRRLGERGIAPADITIHYTSGTRPMSVGLYIAALEAGCVDLTYIDGEREHGIVVTGTERFNVGDPSVIVASRTVQLALRLFELLQFAAVEEVLPDAALLGEYERLLRSDLRNLADAFGAWDSFKHREVGPLYRRAKFAANELSVFRISDSTLERLSRLGQARSSRHIGDRYPDDLLADLWNNAERRYRAERYDDAVVRLYRLVEMLAQARLARAYEVDPDDVDIERLKARGLSSYGVARLEQRCRERDGRRVVQLDRSSAFQLLRELRDPLGQAERQATRLRELLRARNESILAHGTQLVSRKTVDKVAAEVCEFAEIAFPDFRARCRELQFPWLREGRGST